METDAEIDRYLPRLRSLLSLILVYIGLADTTRDADEAGNVHALALDALREPSTLPRRVHVRIARLLLPVESATRRLIVALAAHLPTPTLSVREKVSPPRRAVKPDFITLPRTSVSGVTVPPCLFAAPVPAPAWKAPARVRFSLLDPLKRYDRRRMVRRNSIPRIAVPGVTALHPFVPRPMPTPDDPFPDHRLMRRVAGLAAALDDLPAHARLYARWQARRSARVDAENAAASPRHFRPLPRSSALRIGRPPGSPALRKPRDRLGDEHVLLADCHALAIHRRPRRDSS